LEIHRDEILLENMKTSRARCLTGSKATKILVEKEQKPINSMIT
jgi:hypothetical protein